MSLGRNEEEKTTTVERRRKEEEPMQSAWTLKQCRCTYIQLAYLFSSHVCTYSFHGTSTS